MSTKPSNPKDLVGIRKVGLSSLPFRVLWECATGMFEGVCKYGSHNYRAVGCSAKVYFDAAQRHIGSWWEGEDIDPESGVHHINKAIISLMVLRDSMLEGNWIDDRPIGNGIDLKPLNERVISLIDMHADKKPHHYTRSTPSIKAPALIEVVDAQIQVPVIRVLTYHDSKKINMIKAIRQVAELGLKEAKDLSEEGPGFDVPVRGVITVDEARHILKMAGAQL